jgi:deoxyribonuclease-4
MGWVHGTRMHDGTAEHIARAAHDYEGALTAHAPYAINLCGTPDVVTRSLDRLIHTGRMAARCGAQSFCFHAGTPGSDRERARHIVAKHLPRITGSLRRQTITVDVRPELTGCHMQLGTPDEIIGWSVAVDGVSPCIDFSHQYARHAGAFNGDRAFARMLDEVRIRLGRAALKRLHVHVSGIEYGPHGERKHVALRQSRFRYRELLRALRDFRASGWVICESPASEDDALMLQRAYRRLR